MRASGVSLCILTPAIPPSLITTPMIFTQGGNVVGVIYVPQRGPDTSVYAEYWVMSNRYVYPSEKTPVTTQIVPSTGYHYTSLTDFLTKVPFGDGFHYVTVVACDRTTLPVPARTATTAE